MTAKRLDSRKNIVPEFQPALTIQSAPIPEPGMIGVFVISLVANRFPKKVSRQAIGHLAMR